MTEKNSGYSTVLWWVGWITLTIVAFFVSCWFWTRIIADHVGPMQKSGVPILWVTAVFGSWILLLVPLIILMYSKVDKAYEDSRMEREAKAAKKAREAFPVHSQSVDKADRILKSSLTDKLKNFPFTLKKGHLVTAQLQDGRKIPNVFILNRKELLGVYGMEKLSFKINEIVDVEPADLDHLPDFKTEEWLRLV